jgi:hypothetical protein
MAETYREKLYPVCERMLQLAYEIIDQCELVVPAIAFSVLTIVAGVAAPVGTRIMTISPASC